MTRPRIHIGCSGWNYRHWRGRFYPEKTPSSRWFREYSLVFSTVEVNNTFYRLPEESTFKKWREQAQKDFVYSMKASRYITHMKKLKGAKEPAADFMKRASLLGKHLGPVLFQLPPHWGVDAARLDEFTDNLPKRHRYVFEFRDSSWYDDDVYRILSGKKMSMCLHDMKGSESPLSIVGDVCYIRFHGTSGRYGGSYPLALLKKWIKIIKEACELKKDVYVYFNNDAEAHAPEDALKLIKAVKSFT